MLHFSPGLLPRARRIASSRARRNPSTSSARPTRSSTWTASPALEKSTPTSYVTSRASANLMSMVPPAQPTTRETTRVGCALEVENGTSEKTWDRNCDRTAASREELFDRQSRRQPAAAWLVQNAGEECACGRHAEPPPKRNPPGLVLDQDGGPTIQITCDGMPAAPFVSRADVSIRWFSARRVPGDPDLNGQVQGELLSGRQLALGGLRFFSTSASVIIIIIGSTGHSWNPART